MAKVEKIRVEIDGSARGLKDATRQADGSLQKLGGAAQKLGGLMAGAFAVSAITNFTKASLKAYDIQAKAETKLLTALKGREGIQNRLMKQAADLQKLTLFGDEQTIEAQAFLATMGLSESAIMKLTPLVQDLATKMGTSLTSAADLVAKSVGSSTNALSRYGITIEGAAGSNARLESAVRALNQQVGGQAQAAAGVGTGAMTQLGNAMGDLQEKIGLLLSYAIIPLVQNINKLLDTLDEGNPMEEWFKSGELQAAIVAQAAEIDRLKEKYGENSKEVEKATSFYRQLYDELVKLVPKYEEEETQIIATTEAKKEAINTGWEFISVIDAELEKERERQEIINTGREALQAMTSDYNDLINSVMQFADEEESAIDVVAAMAAATKKQSSAQDESKRSAQYAAAAQAGLALANGQSAKAVIAQSLSVAIAEATKDAIMALPFPANLIAAAAMPVAVMGLFNAIPEFARGTSFAPGGMSLVGERGPELVNLPKGSSVTPNHMMGSGMMGGDLVIKVGEYEFARIINIATQNQSQNVARTTF